MVSAFWQQVLSDGLRLPTQRSIGDLTVELTEMLGNPDPRVRDGLAFPALATWIDKGVYDDLLTGLGDGMAVGLAQGLGESGTDSVFIRSFSALVLAECIDRDTRAHLVPSTKILHWGDRIASWLLTERDERGFIPGKGWAHAIAHGADAIAALGRSPSLVAAELAVMLDVILERLVIPTQEFWVAGEPDRLAQAAMAILRRDMLELDVLEAWAVRVGAAAAPDGDENRHPYWVAGNVQAFLRSLQLQLSLATPQPACRADLLLVLIDQLRTSNPYYLGALPGHRRD